MKKTVVAGLLAAGLALAGAPMASADDGPKDNKVCLGALIGVSACDVIAQGNVLADDNTQSAATSQGKGLRRL
ncbi:hypothetical protein AB0O22_07845 [Streptomyces sp. NPDC091204]|uniref:hypothetical protein n=1 Tax=Streptomyces sp. NPDC091204 TaxID=3155299 RepID=UPI003439F13D